MARREVTVRLRLCMAKTLEEMFAAASSGEGVVRANFSFENYLAQILDNVAAAHRLKQIAVTVDAPRHRAWRNRDFH